MSALEALDRKIRELESKLNLLRELRTEIHADAQAHAPPGTVAVPVHEVRVVPPAETPPGKTSPAPVRSPTASPVKGTILRILSSLADGPKRVKEVAAAAETNDANCSQTLRYHAGRLVEKVEPSNRMSAWQLTAEGRARLEAATADTNSTGTTPPMRS